MKAVVVVAVALALALPAGAATTGPASRTASLRLAAAHPLSLRGSRFLAGERVTVHVVSRGRHSSRTVTARPAGTFMVAFVGMPFDGCDGFKAIASGARGSVAVYTSPDVRCPPRL